MLIPAHSRGHSKEKETYLEKVKCILKFESETLASKRKGKGGKREKGITFAKGRKSKRQSHTQKMLK